MASLNFLLSHFNRTLTFIICICTITLINLGWLSGGVFRISSSLKSMGIKEMVMMRLYQTIVIYKKFNCYNGCILNINIKCFPTVRQCSVNWLYKKVFFPKKKFFCLLFNILSCQIRKQSFLNLSLFFSSNAVSDLATVCSVP